MLQHKGKSIQIPSGVGEHPADERIACKSGDKACNRSGVVFRVCYLGCLIVHFSLLVSHLKAFLGGTGGQGETNFAQTFKRSCGLRLPDM
jgi:hypothetical protein